MLSQFKKAVNSKVHSRSNMYKHFQNLSTESMDSIYHNFVNADNKKQERKSLLQLIDVCYNNIANQVKLAEVLQLPFLGGPVSLHQLPSVLMQQNQIIQQQEQEQTQLQFLFNYLKNVKEYYYCWIIYFNEDLKILNLKLIKKDQIKDHEDMLNPTINLIGIFINRTSAKTIHQDHLLQEYYNTSEQIHKKKELGDQASTNSTGITWKKLIMHIQKTGYMQNEKNSKTKFRSISPKVKFQYQNKGGKGYSIKQQLKKSSQKVYPTKTLKQKSKSQILLNRCKSQNIKQIILQPLKSDWKYLDKNKKGGVKSKLKKQGKVNRIELMYFGREQKKCQAQ